MFSLYISIILCQNFVNSMVRYSQENENFTTEVIVRDAFNEIFQSLKLEEDKYGSKLQENFTNNHQTLQILEDFINVNKSRINSTEVQENNTTQLVEIINEVLNRDIYDSDTEYDEKINNVLLIGNILNKLQDTVEEHDNHEVLININEGVLKRLRNDDLLNVTHPGYNVSIRNDLINSSNDFWEPSGRRIFKGERTKIKHYPFMASIHVFNTFYCAGSIIASDLVITACSCLQLAWNNRFFRENPSFLTIRVGSSFYDGGGDSIAVLEVYFYPGYNPKNLKHNLCLLRLRRHIKFRRRNRHVKKIDFDRRPSPLAVNTPGITIVGWGAKDHSGIIKNPWSNIISYSVLNYYPTRDCQDVYSKEYVTNRNFCAGFMSKGGGACNRDVGGPGISGRTLMGVVSFGPNVCGTPDTPTVFTKLGYYAEWIEHIMEQKVPKLKVRTTLQTTYDPFTSRNAYEREQPTTFKIPPISGKLVPNSVVDYNDNNLRNVNKNVLKELLLTLFNSKELDDFKNIMKVLDDNQNYSDSKNKTQEESTIDRYSYETIKDYTKMIDFENEVTEPTTTHFTANDLILDISENNLKESEILKLIGDSDLEEIIHEEVKNIDPMQNASHINNNLPNESRDYSLYLSDDDNERKDVGHIDEIKDGMSIAETDFKDLTRAGKEPDILSEHDIYKVLYDVIPLVETIFNIPHEATIKRETMEKVV